MNWSDGYHVEAEYTSGYYKELSPTMQRFSALLNGYDLPLASDDDVHMELGFGQGISINIHAAVQPGVFMGNDFNPSHACHAQQLARVSGIKADFSDESFAELANRAQLPLCSSISFHGIWSWISDENRQHMLNIIKRCLKPGGVVYNSYNVYNGHAVFIPWREMMCRYFEQQSGPALVRIEATLNHFKQVFEKNPVLLEQNPALKTSWSRVENANRNYLLHEYFNANWDCFSLGDVSDMMSEAKLQFIGAISAHQYTNHINLNGHALEHVQAQDNILDAESWRDTFISNTFRRDLFVKGGHRLTNREVMERLKSFRFIMTVDVSQFGNYLYAKQDARQFNQDLFEPVRDALASNDYQPKTLQELVDTVDASKYNWSNVLQILLIKMETSQLQVCSVQEADSVMLERARKLNQSLLEALDVNINNVYVAAPTTGQGLSLDFVHAWALRVLLQNPKASLEDVCNAIWQCLESHNRLLLDSEGNSLQGKEANVASLQQTLQHFPSLQKIWTQLGLY